MSKRYEVANPDCDLEVILPGDTEAAGLDDVDAGDYALVIGDPWGSAFAVVGSPAGLWWFARRVQDTVQTGLRFAANFTPEEGKATKPFPAAAVRTPGQDQTAADLAANAAAAFDPGADPARRAGGDHSDSLSR